MKKILTFPIAFLLLGMLISSQLHAQKDATDGKKQKIKVDSIELSGEIYDRMTTRHVLETKIEFLRPDSSLITCTKGGYKTITWTNAKGLIEDSTSIYTLNIPRIEGNYLIKVSRDGYDTEYVPYALSGLKKRENERTAPKIYLSRIKVKNLEEFTVKASKVMFYHKGDTIVYNADAFMLPEGSMLDALIAQMPGVEIKDGGKIYVNGRFVESLLLNGKDFFKGKRDVMLENIGVYAVKDVAVYEKKDEMSAMLGDREDVDKEYVMDVRLKKDHMAGNMINAEAGGGTKSRYLGRLFAMHYTNNSRISLYGNANNINKMNKLDQSEREIEVLTDGGGITRKINGGIDYLADNALHTWEVAGNVDANYMDRNNKSVTNAVNYLQTADNFDFSSINSRARDFAISTAHSFKIMKDRWNMELKPEFSYNKNRNNDETVAATFNREIQNLNESIVKAIYSGNYRDLQSALINRNLKIYESDSHGYDAQLQGASKIKIPNSTDAVELKFTAKYGRKSLFGNTLQDLCFGFLPASSLLQNRFQSDRPKYDFKLQGLARYYFSLPFGSLNASYEYIHTQNRKNSDVSLLEAMAENSMAEFVPGELPVPDLENSYTSKFYKNQHIFKLTWSYRKNFGKMKLVALFEPKFFLERHDLFYHRGSLYADPHRSFVRFNIENARINLNKGDNWELYLVYRMKQTAPNLLNMIDIRDTTDPLNIRLGNPDLKNATNHSFMFSYWQQLSKKFSHNGFFYLNWQNNDFVSGFRYDAATGVRTIRTYNVTGNYSGYLDYYFNYRFGPMEKFYLSNGLTGQFSTYANMIGYDSEPEKQKVNRMGVHNRFRIGYRTKKIQAALRGDIDWNKSRSDSPMITRNNSGSWSAGAFFNCMLPFNFNFNTEFNAVKRFGYVEDSMNTINYLWNAQLGYSIAKGVWRITIDAKDILNQNKGIRYVVNATGRTQTLNTVLPRYLMLSVHYRFDFKPKRKK